MGNRTPRPTDDTDALAGVRSICGHLDDKGGVRRVCVTGPHDDGHHNMKPATPELARSLAARRVEGPGLTDFGSTPAGYFEAPDSDAAEYRCGWAERRLVSGHQEGWRCKLPQDHDVDHDMAFVLRLDGDGDSADTLVMGNAAVVPATGTNPSDALVDKVLERPGQVAAAFGTSTGDLPFQAAHLGVLIPSDRPEDARALAEEAAHVGGLLRTLGQITADYHAHRRLAEPGLLVGLRFQIEALLAARGLDT